MCLLRVSGAFLGQLSLHSFQFYKRRKRENGFDYEGFLGPIPFLFVYFLYHLYIFICIFFPNGIS